jgi:hypothetical protein
MSFMDGPYYYKIIKLNPFNYPAASIRWLDKKIFGQNLIPFASFKS